MMIPPGSTLGMLGGGQLGRMTAMAALRMGYRMDVFEPEAGCPASQVCRHHIRSSYDDELALARFADGVEAATLEFENVPASAVEFLAARIPMHPSAQALAICQSRRREKAFLREKGFPHAGFREVSSAEELGAALRELGVPVVLKSSEFGYDGKGQLKLTELPPDTAACWESFGHPRAVVEQWIGFEAELSVIVARREDGATAAFPVAENIHTHHILDFSIVPGRFAPDVLARATELARSVAHELGIIGLLGVELFLKADGTLLVNELAPRSHNSGHYTIDACSVSQFGQHVRALCGLPLAEPRLLSPVVMVNILGDAWARGTPDWNALLAHPTASLHLYGKAEPRPGRKMGHFCVLAPTADEALSTARSLKQALCPLCPEESPS